MPHCQYNFIIGQVCLITGANRMKRIIKVLGIFLLIIFVIEIFTKKRIDDDALAVYVNDELQSSIPKKGEALFKKAICDNDVKVSWNNDKWGLYVSNLEEKTKCNLYFYEGQTVFNFDYTGGEQTFTVPFSGIYKLETWGSQGGSGVNKNTSTGENAYYLRDGGYGGYSSGYIKLSKESNLYINIGGGGTTLVDNTEDKSQKISGGYNGGGDGIEFANGGGATHIAAMNGTLNLLENYKNNIFIVAGGGGGTSAHAEGGGYCYGGSGGGFKGSNGLNNSHYSGDGGIGGTQTSGYKFGLGISGNEVSKTDGASGGGGGFYGGLGGNSYYSWDACGGGGSGYIGNPLLTNKVMYCYNCEESTEENTKTISTICSEETPTENCAKKGNGYARITLVNIEE